MTKQTTRPRASEDKRPGFGFGIPAAIPGILGAAAITLGAPVAAAVALGMGIFATRLVAGRAVTAATTGATAVVAVGIGAIGGVASSVAASLFTLSVAVGAVVVMNNNSRKYNPKQVLAGVLGGSALGAALTYGAAVNAPQAPAPAAAASTLRIEPQGGTLCRDFKLSENAAASAAMNDKGETTYTLTVPKGCTLKL